MTFNGTDLLGLPKQGRRTLSGNRIAMILQEPMSTLNPVMTVGYQIREAIKSHVSMTNAGSGRDGGPHVRTRPHSRRKARA